MRPIATLLLTATTLLAQPTLTKDDLAPFLDGIIPLQLAREDLAGLTIAVVKDGEVLFAKGYGYSNIANKKPVDPALTLFRPGSVSKLFIWTSVMQQVEQGKINLDQDVNQYLDFRVPAGLTIRHIMTHTSGYEETIKDLFVSRAEDLPSLENYLKNRQPRPLFAPGTTPAYSNYATALAGYIVQRVSGEKLEDYIEKHIFTPLGMKQSSFRQPLPAALQPHMSEGYALASGKPKGFEFVGGWPAGSLSSSALDMSRFVTAHLNYGKLGENRILKEETARQMYTRQKGLAQEMNAMALGFYEESQNGLRIIGHGGDTGWFHSDLHLVHEKNLGIFLSYNSAGKGGADSRGWLWKQILDRYFPDTRPVPPTTANGPADSKLVAGTYLTSRRSDHSLFKPLGILGEAEITALPDGRLQTEAFRTDSGQPEKWRAIGPMLFESESKRRRLRFVGDPEGRLVAVTDFAAFVFERAGFWANQKVHLAIGGFSLGVLALALLFWPVTALVRHRYGERLEVDASQLRWRRWVRAACALQVLALVLWALAFQPAAVGEIGKLSSPLDTRLHLTQALIVVAMLGAAFAIGHGVRTLRRKNSALFKLVEGSIALASVGFLFLVINWNMLDFSLRY